MKTFKEIGWNCGDKVSHHRYDRFYPLFLEPLRNTEFNMLEIGIDEGKSFKLWSEYFPKSKIWGADIEPKVLEHDRCITIQADQSSLNGIIKISNLSPKDCAFIIDDGSHVTDHQILTFHYLFQHNLKPGGVYIVEDIEASWWKPDIEMYGYKTGHKNICEYFKSLSDSIQQEFNGELNLLGIETITFAYNSIIITKSKEEDLALYSREYRWGEETLINKK